MAKRGGFPGGMPGNMNNIMKQAQRMQRQMEETTKELEEKEYTAAAGGGAVTVTVSGKKEVVSIKLSEEVVPKNTVAAKLNSTEQPVTKQYVELMGGAITFQSKKNCGSSFTVEIPMELADEKEIPEQKTVQNISLNGVKAL